MVLPVTTDGTAHGRDIPIEKRFVSPACQDGRRHGQTHFALSEQARDGMTAGLRSRSRHDGAGLRAFERVAAWEISSSPFGRDSRIHRHNLNFLALECSANTEPLNDLDVENFPIQTLRPLVEHGEAIYGVLVIKSF